MSNLALWSRPAWDTDRWLRDFFGPAAAADWFKPATGGFTPAAEIVRDGDDAVVRLELPGVDVDKDVNIEVDRGRLVIHGEHRDEHAEKKEGAPCTRSATDRSAGHSSCRPMSAARPSRLPTTPVC
ncbi:MAG: hypothetical protein QOC58_848 [Mycobacterium sp.]|jgi:HSP20 family molecular chaperone IbpA|nr:hypothetical protein [Mycobacterium sp.]